MLVRKNLVNLSFYILQLVKFKIIRFKDKKKSEVFFKLIFLLFKQLIWFVFLPISLLFHFMGYRRLIFNDNNIGHLAGDLNCFLKEKYLFNLNKKYFIIYNKENIANEFLLNQFSSKIIIIELKFFYKISTLIFSYLFGVYDLYNYSNTLYGNAKIYKINSLCNECFLPEIQNDFFANNLKKIGVDLDDWFVCIHNRSGSFDSNNNKLFHSYRNCSINNFDLSIDLIIRNGGKCIYIGDEEIKNASINEKVINYFASTIRSKEMDIYIISKCKFFLGSTSGLFAVASAYGKPVAMTNVTPLSGLPYSENDIFITKMYYDKEMNIINLKKLKYLNLINVRHSSLIPKDINILENSSHDILLLTQEMLVYVMFGKKMNIHQYDFVNNLEPTDYGFNAASKTCSLFVDKYIDCFNC